MDVVKLCVNFCVRGHWNDIMMYSENSKEMFKIYDKKSEVNEWYFAKLFKFGKYKLNQILLWVTSTIQIWLISKDLKIESSILKLFTPRYL